MNNLYSLDFERDQGFQDFDELTETQHGFLLNSFYMFHMRALYFRLPLLWSVALWLNEKNLGTNLREDRQMSQGIR